MEAAEAAAAEATAGVVRAGAVCGRWRARRRPRRAPPRWLHSTRSGCGMLAASALVTHTCVWRCVKFKTINAKNGNANRCTVWCGFRI